VSNGSWEAEWPEDHIAWQGVHAEAARQNAREMKAEALGLGIAKRLNYTVV